MRPQVNCLIVALFFLPTLLVAQTKPVPTPTVAPDADSGIPTLVVNATATQEDKPRRVGGGVSAPVVLSAPEPQFSQQARDAGVGGTVLVYLQVDPQGLPNKVRVLRGIGMGLDEAAVEAVRQYRFKPAMENGVAVTVEMNVQVNFKIFKRDGSSAMPTSSPNPTATRSADPYSSTLGRPASTPAELAGLQTVADRKRFDEDPKFAKAILEARERGANITADEHLERWKHANKLANNECVACLHAIIAQQMSALQWKDAIVSCKSLDAIGPDPKDKFYAEAEMGYAFMHSNGDNPKPEQTQAALASLQAALATSAGIRALAPASKLAIYTEGRAFARLGREAEAREAFQRYLDTASLTDTFRTRAEHFVANPAMAAQPMAPPFTLTTSEGERINLDDMNGKVVLLDFWATWCGPCKETTPEIQKIAKSFAGQPLVVISISSDTNDVAWKSYINEHNMNWPQYRDSNGALNRAYGVSSIPRFFTIDADGVLQSVKVGSNADISGDLKRLIKKASEKTVVTGSAPSAQD